MFLTFSFIDTIVWNARSIMNSRSGPTFTQPAVLKLAIFIAFQLFRLFGLNLTKLREIWQVCVLRFFVEKSQRVNFGAISINMDA